MFTGAVPQGAGYMTIGALVPEHAYLDALVERMIQQAPDARPSNLEEVKKELIGRKNEFVALQQLDAKRRAVVPTDAPGTVVASAAGWCGLESRDANPPVGSRP